MENSSLVSDIYVGDDGYLHKVKDGADSVLPFKNAKLETFGNTYIGNTNAVTILTIPKSGTLLIAATISNNSKVYQAGIAKNGAFVNLFSQGVNANYFQVAWSGAVNKGDTIQVWAQGNSNNANNYAAGSYVLL